MTNAGPTRRPTRYQAAVAGLLDRSDDFTSVQTLPARLREAGQGVRPATVYRTLRAMAEAGTVDKSRTGADCGIRTVKSGIVGDDDALAQAVGASTAPPYLRSRAT